jgi:hypothetical protein
MVGLSVAVRSAVKNAGFLDNSIIVCDAYIPWDKFAELSLKSRAWCIAMEVAEHWRTRMADGEFPSYVIDKES